MALSSQNILFKEKMLSWRGARKIATEDKKEAKTGMTKKPHAQSDFSILIRKLRMHHGISGAKLAKMLEKLSGHSLHVNTVNSWGRGVALPSGEWDSVLVPLLKRIESETECFDDTAKLQPDEIKELIALWREETQVTSLAELATFLGVPNNTVVRWARGQYAVSRKRIDELAQKFGLSSGTVR